MNRDTHASSLEWLTDRIVVAVHEEDPAAIRRAVAMALSLTPPEGVDPAVAVIVALAAQVSPDREVSDRLRWVETYGDRVDYVDVVA